MPVQDLLRLTAHRDTGLTLLLLAHHGKSDGAHRVLPRISRQTLADMVGTTRSRVNAFMNKFKKLGFVDYSSDCLTVKAALLTVLLCDEDVDVRPRRTG